MQWRLPKMWLPLQTQNWITWQNWALRQRDLVFNDVSKELMGVTKNIWFFFPSNFSSPINLRNNFRSFFPPNTFHENRPFQWDWEFTNSSSQLKRTSLQIFMQRGPQRHNRKVWCKMIYYLSTLRPFHATKDHLRFVHGVSYL